MSDGGIRDDLVDGVRFLHAMGMETKLEASDTSARITALIDELVASGTVSGERLAARIEVARQAEHARNAGRTVVHVSPTLDKYEVQSPPVDCAALMPLCRGRCCKLVFPLSFQDLDERVLEFEYATPYMIRHRTDDGYCVHSDREHHGCTVYAKRPAVCRSYDCRKDTRIWTDFEQRIPAPLEATDLVQLRKRA